MGGGLERWQSATSDQREEIWARLLCLESPSVTDVNDFIWFHCDDILD